MTQMLELSGNFKKTMTNILNVKMEKVDNMVETAYMNRWRMSV